MTSRIRRSNTSLHNSATVILTWQCVHIDIDTPNNHQSCFREPCFNEHQTQHNSMRSLCPIESKFRLSLIGSCQPSSVGEMRLGISFEVRNAFRGCCSSV